MHPHHPWRRKWQPTPVFLPGESHGQRNLGVHGIAQSLHDWSDLTRMHHTYSQKRCALRSIRVPMESSRASWFKKKWRGLPWCLVLKSQASTAEGTDSIPGQGTKILQTGGVAKRWINIIFLKGVEEVCFLFETQGEGAQRLIKLNREKHSMPKTKGRKWELVLYHLFDKQKLKATGRWWPLGCQNVLEWN